MVFADSWREESAVNPLGGDLRSESLRGTVTVWGDLNITPEHMGRKARLSRSITGCSKGENREEEKDLLLLLGIRRRDARSRQKKTKQTNGER